MPAPRSGAPVRLLARRVALVIGGTGTGGIVAASTLTYDARSDAWSTEADMPTPRTALAAWIPDISDFRGWSFDTGDRRRIGLDRGACDRGELPGFIGVGDLAVPRPQNASVSQAGIATGRTVGTATIVASAGSIRCTISSCHVVRIAQRQAAQTLPDRPVCLDVPSNSATVSQPFDGRRLGDQPQRHEPAPASTPSTSTPYPDAAAAPIFLGAATYGSAAPTSARSTASQFTNCGFTLTRRRQLAAGSYTHHRLRAQRAAGTLRRQSRAPTVTVTAPVSNGLINVDSPTPRPGRSPRRSKSAAGRSTPARRPAPASTASSSTCSPPARRRPACLRRHRQLRRRARRRRRRLRLAVHQLGLPLHDHRPRPGQLHARRLRAQHRDRQLQHRQDAALHRSTPTS